MCALFLIQAAKKADREFCCYQSGHHTIREADTDITKMVGHLLQAQVSVEQQTRRTPGFIDPTNNGLDKLCYTDWVNKTLAKQPCEKELQRDTQEDSDLTYELSDIY